MTATNDLSKLTKDFLKLNKETVRSLKAKDKIYLPDEKGQVDLNGLFANDNTNDNDNNNSNDTGDNGNGTIPDSGVNIDPGKSLSGVKKLWEGTTDVSNPVDVTLADTGIATGEGVQFQLQIIKTPVTNGQGGSTSVLPVVASTDTKPQEGKYVASVPIPISILTKDLVIGQTINVPLDGIGEGLATTKITKSPSVSFYIKSNTVITIKNNQGYALDKSGTGNNGAFYDVQIVLINSFTRTKPVQQLPNGSILYTGKIVNKTEIKLTNLADSFSNVGDGIIIEFGDLSFTGFSGEKVKVTFEFGKFNVNKKLMIPKASLMIGNTFSIKSNLDGFPSFGDGSYVMIANHSQAGSIVINQQSLTYTPCLMSYRYSSREVEDSLPLPIVKITTYMN